MLRYVQDGLANGKTKDQLQKELLLAGGWQVSDIDEVFAAVEGRMVVPPKPKSHIGRVVLFLILLGGVGYTAWYFYGAQIQARIAVFVHPHVPVTQIQEPTVYVPIPDTPPAAPDPSTIEDPYTFGTPAYAAIEAAVKAANKKAKSETDRPIAVTQQIDLTGDGIAELLVATGIGGGAENQLTIVQFIDNIPHVVKVNYKGKISYFFGFTGAGGAGRYSDDVVLLPEQQIILATSYSVYGKPEDYCIAIAYVWNPVTKVFEYNQILSDQKTQDMMPQCLQIASDTSVTYKGTTTQ